MTRQEVRHDTLNLLREVGLIKVVPEKTKKEPAPQEAETSSNTNILIRNDNTENKKCQEKINYFDKYRKYSDFLSDIELYYNNLKTILNHVYNEWCVFDIGEEQISGAACLKTVSNAPEHKAAVNLLFGYNDLFQFISMSLDYLYEIKKILEKVHEQEENK